MKRIRISFFTNKYENNHLMLSGYYLIQTVKNIFLSLIDLLVWIYRRVIKKYPLVVVGVFAAICIVLSMVKIAEARSERDKATHELYITAQKLKSYQALYDEK